jgi:hypothetical protein
MRPERSEPRRRAGRIAASPGLFRCDKLTAGKRMRDARRERFPEHLRKEPSDDGKFGARRETLGL